MDMNNECSPEVKAKALALVDEAVSLLEAEGVSASEVIESHLEGGEEMDEDPKDKKAMIVLALKKKMAGQESEEEA